MQTSDAERETIIVADHDVIERNAIADYLRHCGYTVIEAATSDEVLAVLEQVYFSISTVLCDALIGGSLNAFELRAWLREHRPSLTVALAGSAERKVDAATDLCEAGPDLARPYSPDLVLAYLKRMKANGAQPR